MNAEDRAYLEGRCSEGHSWGPNYLGKAFTYACRVCHVEQNSSRTVFTHVVPPPRPTESDLDREFKELIT